MSIFLNGKEIYKGCVIRLWERNGYNDSDFYASVWDEETKSIKEYEYDTTRFAGGGSAVIDATEEILTKAAKYKAKCLYVNEVKKRNTDISINSYVTVVKGRKVAKGTHGKVIGIYENAYSRWNPKVRLLLGDESKVYTYMDNLKVDPMSINDKINLKMLIMDKYNINSFEI